MENWFYVLGALVFGAILVGLGIMVFVYLGIAVAVLIGHFVDRRNERRWRKEIEQRRELENFTGHV